MPVGHASFTSSGSVDEGLAKYRWVPWVFKTPAVIRDLQMKKATRRWRCLPATAGLSVMDEVDLQPDSEQPCVGFAGVDDDSVGLTSGIHRIAHGLCQVDADQLLIVARACPAVDLNAVVVSARRPAQVVVGLAGHYKPRDVRRSDPFGCQAAAIDARRVAHDGLNRSGIDRSADRCE